jgi:hypothetical protein
MQGHFLFTFALMAGWRFYLNNDEVEEPIGWDAIEFTALRMESHGIDQPFSTEVRFYGKGARLIKDLYDLYFINAEIAIKITSDVGYSGQLYEFEGMLNLSIYQEHNVCDTDSWEVTVGIIDDNFREQFKARQDVEIDLTSTTDLNGDAIATLTQKEIRLHRQDLYLQANGKNLADSSTFLQKNIPATNKYAVVPTYWQQSDLKENYGSTFDTQGLFITGDVNLGDQPIFQNNGNTSRTLSYSITIDFTLTNNDLTGPIDVEFDLLQFNGNIQQSFPPSIVLYNVTLGAGASVSVSNTYTGSFTIATGIKLNLYFAQTTISSTPNAVTVDIDKGYTISLSEINAGDFASTANCLTIEQWLRRAIYMMTGSNNKLLSDAFSESGNGCYWNNALTNGLRIRQADGQDNLGSLKTSWKKTFDDLDKIFCLGWAFEWTGTEWKIRVEPRDYFYQDSLSQTFANVGEVDQMAKVDLLKNNLTLGYDDKWKNIQLSGVYAIHTDRNYFVNNAAMNEASSAKEDLRSGIIAEGYAIEFSRRLSGITFGGATSDRPNDYETFIIWLNKFELSFDPIQDTIFNLPQETGSKTFAPGEVSMPSNYITASSGPLSGLYNIYHTPARVACRWWKVLGMHTYGTTNPRLRFQVGQYQTNYDSTINGDEETEACIEILNGQIVESSDIYAGILNTAYKDYLFKPIGIEFSYPQSLCDFLTLSQDEQYRKVRLTSGSLDVQGFITEATNQPEDASGGTTKFSLLMAATASGIGGAYSDGFSIGFDNGE